MTQRLDTPEGSTGIPGSYPSFNILAGNTGTPQAGIMLVLGESDGGPDWTQETDLTQNFYRPDQIGAVRAKYVGGRIVDGVNAAFKPSQDVKLKGAPNAVYIVKVNPSTKAYTTLLKVGGGTYHYLADKNWGDDGNLIAFQLTAAQSEAVPTTGPFTLLLPNAATDLRLRVNGGAAINYSMVALDTPTATVAGLDALAGVDATGGVSRVPLAVAGTLAAVASVNQLTFTRSVAWATAPTAGDTAYVPPASPVGGTHAFLKPSVTVGGSNIDTILALNLSGAGGNSVTLATVADAMAAAGSVAVVGNAITVHYDPTVSTVADFEALFAGGLVVTAGKVYVATAGTGATVLTDPADTFSSTAFHSGADENAGSYVITAVGSTTITATKLLDASGGPGALTTPVTVQAWPVLALTDLQAYSPAVVSLTAAVPVDGYGKSMEIAELTSAAGRLSDLAYQLNTTKVTWVSKTGAAEELDSVAEYAVSLADSRQRDSVYETAATTSGVTALGGDVVMSVGYLGDTATMTITNELLTTTVTGGAGTSLSIKFKQFVTISDLVSFVAAQPGYTATLLLPEYGPKAPGAYKAKVTGYLDRVVAVGICTTFGAEPGRVKSDAHTFFAAVQSQRLVQLGTANPSLVPQPATPVGNIQAAAGLPAVAAGYLTGGTKAGSTAAAIQAAIGATERIAFNFGVLLLAQDATLDIEDGETESTSTYTLAAAVTYARLQAERLQGKFERKPRLWFAGVMGSYVATQRPFAIAQATQGLLTLAFMDTLALGVDAETHQYQPWYCAVLLAAMQAAALARGIVHKEPTQSGFVHRFGDFNPENKGMVQNALDSGLCPVATGQASTAAVGGKGRWTVVSDQTCYTRDNSFFYNSFQALNVFFLLEMSVSSNTEDQIVGESNADVDAQLVKRVVAGEMAKALALGYTASDDEAPLGYVAINVSQTTSSTFKVSIQKCKLATLVYFIDMNFSVSQVTRNA